MIKTIRIGTRGSPLALWQAQQVENLIQESYPDIDVQIIIIKTHGDKNPSASLINSGGTGIFVKELENALRENRIDVAVHSAKDMPHQLPEALVIAAVLPRDSAEDVLISKNNLSLPNLPAASVIGTSSPRRQAQLLAYRDDLIVKPIRGNIATRISKVDEGVYDATILAKAGIDRLGLTDEISEILGLELMLPAPGQGIVAIECRESDRQLHEMLNCKGDLETFIELQAERSFLAGLNAGCSTAIAGKADYNCKDKMQFTGKVLTSDGKFSVETQLLATPGEGAMEMGMRAASVLLDSGAAELLSKN
ncbi:MAG: hydroxymethylbilane synthase [Candidatus Electryonea clarkiae]|nr:hydroxymethylbilane synthase [Candidatus Electryonea clarkiae]MDP8286331.1 hydroxymethylbilane synthase [Candidatus Electryonea clarkiae]